MLECRRLKCERSRLQECLMAAGMLLIASGPTGAADRLPEPATAAVDFARDVRPLLEKHCFSCHGAEKQRSSFRLDQRSAAFKGGDYGVAITPGKSAESDLIRYVAGVEEGIQMPPEGEPLSAKEIGVLRRWIDDGATWPQELAGEPATNPADWWSLKPIVSSPPPEVAEEDRSWVRTPIDAFIADRLHREGLLHAPEADRRTLIRRLTFDLHGLPPAPEEVEQFVNDTDPLAYETLVDRLLQSERYGERWARHWLDVAHYADSHGHDQDRIRPNAWPYRDYVIRALNDDLPYARFVAEQVAGDVLSPNDPDAIAATGFLAAGPFDESSLVSINENSIDRIIGQYLDRDDIVTTTMSTFCGLTVGCARCHDHKFDAITQRDYYALQAVFAGIDKAERAFDADPAVGLRRRDLRQRLTQLEQWKGTAEPTLLTPERLSAVATFEEQRAAAESAWTVLDPIQWQAAEGSILKALLDRSILAVGAAPARDTYTIAGTTSQPSVAALRLEVLVDETLPAQGPGRAENGNLHLTEFRVKAASAASPEEFVDVRLKSAKADFNQADWEIHKAIDGNSATAWGIHPAEGASHTAVFEFESPVAFPEGAVFRVELEQHHGRQHTIGRFRLSTASQNGDLVGPLPAAIAQVLAIPSEKRTEAQQGEISSWLWRNDIERELAALPPESHVFCGTNQFVPDGSFKPANEPRVVHVLGRGEVARAGELAVPGTIAAVEPLTSEFALSSPGNEGERRRALADWLTSPENPLTWRVIVNRVWHDHFGRGIVDTPNDLGHMGGLPSHPELLDWLAAEFRDSGGSLKQLHRLIVLSSVYRQTTQHDPVAAEKDADNRLLWRMNRRRLDAESVRDAIVFLSGRLDATMYGPPVMQFNITPGIHVTPDADYAAFDVDSAASRRRSVYRLVLRTRPDPLMDVLDCPDSSQSAPVRSSSVSALQALALWNDKFTLRYAEHLAERTAAETDDPVEQVRVATERVLSRPPTAEESTLWVSYATRHGLPNLCRVLLNSSEFLFVE